MGRTAIFVYVYTIWIIVYYLVFALINKSIRVPLSGLLAIKETEERTTALDVSIPADSKDVTFVSENIQGFLLEHGVDSRVAYKTALCAEEIAADYIWHKSSTEDNGKDYMDIKVFRDPEKIEVLVRNYDDPYDPLVFDKQKDSVSKIGITMIQKISEDIKYSYAYHMNVVTIAIKA